jgi:hypothetical protein
MSEAGERRLRSFSEPRLRPPPSQSLASQIVTHLTSLDGVPGYFPAETNTGAKRCKAERTP